MKARQKVAQGTDRVKRAFTAAIAFGLSLVLIGSYAAAEEQADTTESSKDAASAPQTAVPEILTIEILSNLYESVVFTHNDHTSYADNCETCHHHSAPGVTASCSKCHSSVPRAQATDKTLIGLKGAYHKQCMGCHKEMGSGPVGCTDCHAKKRTRGKKDKEKGDEQE